MTHPDESTPDLDPTADIPTQIWSLITWVDDRLVDESADHRDCLKQLLDHLIELAERAAAVS